MSIKKSDNGTWMYDVRHPITKRRKRVNGFRSKSEADMARSVIIAIWRGQKHGVAVGELRGLRLSLRDELEMETKLLYAEGDTFFTSTKRKVSSSVRKISTYLPESLNVTDLQPEHLEQIVKGEIARGIKPRSVETYMSQLTFVLNRVKNRHREALAHWNIPTTAVPKDGRDDAKLRRIWTPEEVDSVLGVLSDPSKYRKATPKVIINWRDTHDFISIDAMTGMRKTEILILEWPKIFFDWNIIMARTLKKKRNAEVYREIPMSADLRALLLARRDTIHANYGSTETRVFPRWNGTNSSWIYRTLEEACRAAGVQYGQGEFGVVPHGLRHTAATRMITSGVDIATAAEILGNTVVTMMRHYAHTTMESKISAMESLNISREEIRKRMAA